MDFCEKIQRKHFLGYFHKNAGRQEGFSEDKYGFSVNKEFLVAGLQTRIPCFLPRAENFRVNIFSGRGHSDARPSLPLLRPNMVVPPHRIKK